MRPLTPSEVEAIGRRLEAIAAELERLVPCVAIHLAFSRVDLDRYRSVASLANADLTIDSLGTRRSAVVHRGRVCIAVEHEGYREQTADEALVHECQTAIPGESSE